jgi:hypothetical protein
MRLQASQSQSKKAGFGKNLWILCGFLLFLPEFARF